LIPCDDFFCLHRIILFWKEVSKLCYRFRIYFSKNGEISPNLVSLHRIKALRERNPTLADYINCLWGQSYPLGSNTHVDIVPFR
jgi:hypothetical protein